MLRHCVSGVDVSNFQYIKSHFRYYVVKRINLRVRVWWVDNVFADLSFTISRKISKTHSFYRCCVHLQVIMQSERFFCMILVLAVR